MDPGKELKLGPEYGAPVPRCLPIYDGKGGRRSRALWITQITTNSPWQVVYREPDAGQLDDFVEENPVIKVRLAAYRVSLHEEEWNLFGATGGKLPFENWIRLGGLEKYLAKPTCSTWRPAG